MATPAQVQAAVDAALDAERAARAATVSVKLPTFWPNEAELWFAQAEAQFQNRGITAEKTKYNYVVSMLDVKTAKQVMDIIRTPPAANPYTTLKARLSKAFALSDSEKVGRILDMTGLGDRTPSQCLSDMLQLVPEAEAQDPGSLFREIFLRQLPSEVRTHLAQTTKTGTTSAILRDLAADADKYFSSTGSRIASVSPPIVLPPPQVQAEAEVSAVSNQGGNPRHRSQGPVRGPKPSFTFCYYHARFGDKARSCTPPCQFGTLPSGNSQPGRKLAN